MLGATVDPITVLSRSRDNREEQKIEPPDLSRIRPEDNFSPVDSHFGYGQDQKSPVDFYNFLYDAQQDTNHNQ